jgi:hypothetical protein
MRTTVEFSTGIAVANGVLLYMTTAVVTCCRLVYRITHSVDRPHTHGGRSKGKGKVHPRTGHEGPQRGIEVQLYSFVDLGARWGVWSTPRPGRFTPGKEPESIV